MASEEKLEACPLCAGPAYYTESVNGTHMAYIGCSRCGISMKAAWVPLGPPGVDGWSKDIRAVWNTRPSPSVGVGELREAEIAVIEAARDLVMKPGGLVNRYRLCTAFERLAALSSIPVGGPETAELTPPLAKAPDPR
jgi:hypothetical protein